MKLKRFTRDILKIFLKNRPPAEPYDSEPHKFSGDKTLVVNLMEGIHGTFYYHYSIDGKTALCGDKVMPTRIPESAWGTRTHLNERYCSRCASIRGRCKESLNRWENR